MSKVESMAYEWVEDSLIGMSSEPLYRRTRIGFVCNFARSKWFIRRWTSAYATFLRYTLLVGSPPLSLETRNDSEQSSSLGDCSYTWPIRKCGRFGFYSVMADPITVYSSSGHPMPDGGIMACTHNSYFDDGRQHIRQSFALITIR